jgi:hypothetical protein
MNKLLMLGAGLALLGAAGVASAQPTSPPSALSAPQVQPAPPPGGPDRPMPPPPPGGPRGPGMGDRPMGPMMAPPHSRAASFMLERGDASIHIHCAEGEPMQACVNAASALLDKVGGMTPR